MSTWHVHEPSSGALKAAISALFAEARDCVGDECAAYVSWPDPTDPEHVHHCVFECILSVANTRPTSLQNRHYIPTGPVDAQHAAALGKVQLLFPEHAKQRVLFRSGPWFEYRDDGESGTTLWMRLGAVPLDVNEFLPRTS